MSFAGCIMKLLWNKTILLAKLPLGLGNNNKIWNKASVTLSHRTKLNVIKILYDRLVLSINGSWSPLVYGSKKSYKYFRLVIWMNVQNKHMYFMYDMYPTTFIYNNKYLKYLRLSHNFTRYLLLMILILLFVALAGNWNMLISEMIEIPTLGRTFMFEYIEQLVFRKMQMSQPIIRRKY